MKKLIIAALSGALLTQLLVGQNVSGQGGPPPPPPPPGGGATATPTATPTATVTPTPTLPTGAQLVTQTKALAKSKGSTHTQTSLKLTISGLAAATYKVQSDVSWKQSRIHVTGTLQASDLTKKPPKKSTVRIEFRLVGKRSATRQGTGKWSCSRDTTNNTLNSNVGVLAGFLYARAPGAQNLGAGTVDGVAIWHVRTKQPDYAYFTKKLVPADLYIAQSDFSVVRYVLTGTVKSSGTSIRQNITNDYSSYGEAVTVTIPTSCGSAAAQLSEPDNLSALSWVP